MKRIAYLLIISILAWSCDKDEINITTGPLNVTEITYEGTDEGSGTLYTATLASVANDVPLDAVITATFSKDVDASTVSASTVTLSDGASTVGATVSVSGKVITVTPSAELEREKAYELIFSNDVKATDGGLLAEAANFAGVKRTMNTIGQPPYVPAGQIAYWSFNFDYKDFISKVAATAVGSPGFANASAAGPNAFQAATDSYLTFPTTNLTNAEFTATFWYKVNASPDRAGILVMGPPDDTPPANDRTKGFRFFRENAGGKQRFKLNVGNGTADTWFDGGAAADLANNAPWAFMAFTISATECVVYINGEVVKQGTFSGVDWTGCNILSIGSGDPRFVEWGHRSDLSFIDELRIFDVALPQSEIQKMME